MRVSLNWLKDYIALDDDVDALAEKMTMLGLEIEAVERKGDEFKSLVVGEIKSIEPHPDADKLVVCQTDVGAEVVEIVCGAKNMKVGDRVPTVLVGGSLPGGFKIGKRKMRGVTSHGMMCSAKELGLGEDHSGLLILKDHAEPGADVLDLLHMRDVVFEIEITPNRGDWASMVGIARELAAAYGKQYCLPKPNIPENGPPIAEFTSVTIEDPDLCPRYAGRVLENVKIGPSPAWLCQRLVAAGQRPINNVVDITNYVLLETGHPLHAFDYDTLDEHRIVVRRALPGERIKSLDGETRMLSGEMLVIADAAKPVAIAGVMGGEETEVGEGTSRVFLESAYFKPQSVRKTARSLSMNTEASAHFQRGADPDMVVRALDRAAELMVELCGATCAQGAADEYPVKVEQSIISLRYARTNALLGAEIDGEEQKGYLAGLGFEVVGSDAESCAVRVPTWRHDMREEADLIEEVARLYGYDRIVTTLPVVHRTEEIFAPEDRAERKLRDFLVGIGLDEVVHWTFSCREDVAKAKLDKAYPDLVSLANPLSEKQANMRPSLIPALLQTATYNVRRGSKNLALFEIGPVYRPVPESLQPEQQTHLAVLLTGANHAAHWSETARPVTFYDLKGYAEVLLESLASEYTYTEVKFGPWKPGATGRIAVGESILGHFGEIDKGVLDAFDLDQTSYVMELDITTLLTAVKPHAQFEEPPKFPPSLRDMAVVVGGDTPAGDIAAAAQEAGGRTLKSVDIFDVYTGEQVPAGKKSVALSLVFQGKEGTLRDEDTQKSWDKILKRLQTKFDAELR